VKTKTLGVISLVCLVGTAFWIVLMIAGMASAGPQDTFEQVLAYVSRLDILFYLAYINAAFLVTVPAILLMTGLYNYCKSVLPAWSRLGAVFVPIYGTMNLFAYLSQISIVPALVHLRQTPDYEAICDVLLRLTIQQWPESAVTFFNGLAYAILGIPSIIFGIALSKHQRPQRIAGALLALNGVACILGIVGWLVGSDLLGSGTLIGGVLYLLALPFMIWHFLREA
jgi:hypothetical protein